MTAVVRPIIMVGLLLSSLGAPTWELQPNPAAGVVEEFKSAYNSKDLDKLTSLYASDAIMVSETGIAEGHDAIKARLGVGVKKGNTIAQLYPAKGESSGILSYTEGSAEIISGDQHLRRRYLVLARRTGTRKEIILHYSLPIVERNVGR